MFTLGLWSTDSTMHHTRRPSAAARFFSTTRLDDQYVAEGKAEKYSCQATRNLSFVLLRSGREQRRILAIQLLAEREGETRTYLPLLRQLARGEQKCRGPEHANVPLKLGGEDGRLCGKLAVDRVLGYRLAYLVEKGLANSGDTSADHDRFWVEQRDHAGKPDAKVEA